VFEKVGRFDEQFDLYFGDNDFALTLKKNSIVHAMVPSSFVEHKGGYTTKNYDASGTPQYDEDKARFTKKWKEPFMVSFGKRVIRFVTRWLVPGKLRRTRY
jgi:GT2 family glycosyltransferase